MGMAASQARFLGLTARKSNVEYQGQQVNQERTSLSNESANLYNQMMELKVPTPPNSSDFYTTVYTLDNSSGSYAKGDYRIVNAVKTYAAEDQYNVTLAAKKEYVKQISPLYRLGELKTVEQFDADKNAYDAYRITLHDARDNSASPQYITYDPKNTNAYTGSNNSLNPNVNQIYEYNPAKYLTGAEQCCTDKNAKYYFYQDKNGNNHFLTEEKLQMMIDPEKTNETLEVPSVYTYSKDETTQVVATLTKAASGRYSSIQIADDEEYPNELKNAEFTISATQEYDEAAYTDAMNDYEYNKQQYEKSISDINAQTEVLQSEDQQLELRLKQLDTEQNAITTEMDAVQKVIENNVEKTFNVFG